MYLVILSFRWRISSPPLPSTLLLAICNRRETRDVTCDCEIRLPNKYVTFCQTLSLDVLLLLLFSSYSVFNYCSQLINILINNMIVYVCSIKIIMFLSMSKIWIYVCYKKRILFCLINNIILLESQNILVGTGLILL